MPEVGCGGCGDGCIPRVGGAAGWNAGNGLAAEVGIGAGSDRCWVGALRNSSPLAMAASASDLGVAGTRSIAHIDAGYRRLVPTAAIADGAPSKHA